MVSALFDRVGSEPEFDKKTVDLFNRIAPQEPLTEPVTKPLMEGAKQKPAEAQPISPPNQPADPSKSESIYARLFDLAPKSYRESIRVPEKTPEQLKKMSISEKLEYIEDQKRERQYLQSSGIVKGALSGATLGLSEKIPGLKPDEEDALVGIGEFVGAALPISKLYNYLGKPLVSLAAKSPYAKTAIQSLARMTGFGVTGATYETAKDTIKSGEIPSSEDIIRHGAEWAAFDGALQALGKAKKFTETLFQSIKGKKVSGKEALTKIIEDVKSKGIDIEKEPEKAVQAAEEILSKEKPGELSEKLTAKPVATETPLSVESKSTEPLLSQENVKKPNIEPEAKAETPISKSEYERLIGKNFPNSSSFVPDKRAMETLAKDLEKDVERLAYAAEQDLKEGNRTSPYIQELKQAKEQVGDVLKIAKYLGEKKKPQANPAKVEPKAPKEKPQAKAPKEVPEVTKKQYDELVEDFSKGGVNIRNKGKFTPTKESIVAAKQDVEKHIQKLKDHIEDYKVKFKVDETDHNILDLRSRISKDKKTVSKLETLERYHTEKYARELEKLKAEKRLRDQYLEEQAAKEKPETPKEKAEEIPDEVYPGRSHAENEIILNRIKAKNLETDIGQLEKDIKELKNKTFDTSHAETIREGEIVKWEKKLQGLHDKLNVIKGKLEKPKGKTSEATKPKVEKAEYRHTPEKMTIKVGKEKAQAKIKEIEAVPVEKRKPEQTQELAEAKQAQPEDPPEKLFESAPLPDNPSFMQKLKNALLKPKTKLTDTVWKLKEDYYGRRAHLLWQNRTKWNKVLKENKFKAKDLSDMQFFIEEPEAFGKKRSDPGTGNPFVGEGDTYEALEARLSPEAKKVAKEIVEPHFDEWRNLINDSAYTKKINPREFLEGVYIPHFYSGDSKKGAKQAAEVLSKRFTTNNPFANKRTLLTYNDALIKAGMKPKFDNIADLLNEYDRVMTRVLVNSELAGRIRDLETRMGEKLIVRSTDKSYADAKSQGWEPFSDPYLRRYVAGIDKEGKPIFATLETPALVHPEVADALTGIFVKDTATGKDQWLGWKGYDAISDKLKSIHVGFSPFHYVSLAEESAKVSGPRLIKNFKRGGELLKDPVFMKDFLEAGGTIHTNPEIESKANSVLKKYETDLKLGTKSKKLAANGIHYMRKFFDAPSKFLFEQVQPRWKTAAFYDMRARELNRYAKKGIALTEGQKKDLDKELARLTNDMFGGQMFELMRNPTTIKALDLHNPDTLKKWRRFGGYVDWSVSAAREFGKTAKGIAELAPGVKGTATGRQARLNLAKYGVNLFMATEMLNYFFTGFHNKDDGSIGWDWDKAHSTFENQDPSKHWYAIELPDLEVNLLGEKRNFGRDEKGRKLYTHFGKKMFEIFHYGTDPVAALFSKSNPVVQAMTVQILNGTPSTSDIFKAQGEFVEGKLQPWKGKKGLAQAGPRAIEASRTLLPFAGQRIAQEGWSSILPYVATGFGSIPISKGVSLTKSEELFEKYLTDAQQYNKELANLRNVLTDQGYTPQQVKRTETKVRNRLKKRGEK